MVLYYARTSYFASQISFGNNLPFSVKDKRLVGNGIFPLL